MTKSPVPMKKAVLHSDGASLGNPGPAGVGAVIETPDCTVEIAESIGETTNNVAEYTAFLRALEEAQLLGVEEIDAMLDSELIVRQVNGVYKVKQAHLIPLYQKIMGLLKGFRKYRVRHIPREENTRADALSKKGAESTPHRPHKKVISKTAHAPSAPHAQKPHETTKHDPKQPKPAPKHQGKLPF